MILLLNHTFLFKQPLFHCCGKIFIFSKILTFFPFSICPVVTETTGSVSGVSLTSELNEELNDLIQRFHNQLHDSQVSSVCHYQFLFYLTRQFNVCLAHLCVLASKVTKVHPKLENSANLKILNGY